MVNPQLKSMEKFSYSKLNTYESCPYKFKLQYRDFHFPDSTTIANEFGTLVHFIEEIIAKDIVANNDEPIFMLDDRKYVEMFLHKDSLDGDTKILCVDSLKQKYDKQHFIKKDKQGFSYNDKITAYLETGIHRLQKYLAENRQLRIIATEKEFQLEHKGYLFHGFIDRAFKNIETGEIYVEDIKTWDTIKGHELKTPLQLVLYSIAASQIFEADKVACGYDLPIIDERHKAGSAGYIEKGIAKIDKILSHIEAKEFEPNPTPLCHWCVFSPTYIEGQPEEGKGLCPYFCHWTKVNKDFSVEFEWAGKDNHEKVLEAYAKQIERDEKKIVVTKAPVDSSRRFLIRK